VYFSCVTNRPGLRNPQLSKRSLLRRGPYSSPVSIHFGSVDSQETDSTDCKVVYRHWRWFSYSTGPSSRGRSSSVTQRTPPNNSASQKLRGILLCKPPGKCWESTYVMGLSTGPLLSGPLSEVYGRIIVYRVVHPFLRPHVLRRFCP